MKLKELYENWLTKNQKDSDGNVTIFANRFLDVLLIHKIINLGQAICVKSKRSMIDKNRELFVEIMPSKNIHGLKKIIKILQWNNNIREADNLMQMAGLEIDDKDPFYSLPPSVAIKSLLNKNFEKLYLVQRHLEDYILFTGGHDANFWRGLMPRRSSEIKNFIKLQIVNNLGEKTDNEVESYESLFRCELSENQIKQKRNKRIIIEGEPGYGVSTFINELTHEWAMGDKYLRSLFDIVLPCKLHLPVTIVDPAYHCYLPPNLLEFVESELKLPKHNRILIIFDGFSEYDKLATDVYQGDVYDYVQSIFSNPVYHNATIIVTVPHVATGRYYSSVDCDQWVISTGFDDESIQTYLKHRKIKFYSDKEFELLLPLLRIPLFCTIYCFLYEERSLPEKVEDLYDLIKAFVDFKMENEIYKESHTRKQSCISYDTTMSEEIKFLGKCAMSQLDIIITDLIESLQVQKVCYLDIDANLHVLKSDLVIKKKIPQPGYLQFKESYSFPHKLITEYLAACYFADTMDLTSFDPSLVAKHTDLPFVQYLLYNLLCKLESKLPYQEEVIQKCLSVPEIYWTWVCKNMEAVVSDCAFVRIRFDGEIDDVRKIEIFAKKWNKNNIFDVTVKSNSTTRWKPVWWEQMENLIHSKITTVLIFSTTKLTNRPVGSLIRPLCVCNIFMQIQKRPHKDLAEGDFEEFQEKFLNYEEIKEISFQENKELGEDVAFFQLLNQCANVEFMEFISCHLSPQCAAIFIKQLGEKIFSKLQHLIVTSCNEIGRSNEFFINLLKCEQLIHLNLRFCDILPSALSGLYSDSFNSLPNLETIDLTGNAEIGNVYEFFDELKNCQNLKNLTLINCGVTRVSLLALSEGFVSEKFQNLEQLVLRRNEEISKDYQFIATIQYCRNLKVLNFCSCNLSSLSVQVFASLFDNLLQLKIINLEDNEEVGKEITFFANVPKCLCLESLNLYSCGITASSIATLCDNLKSRESFVNLEELNFGKTQEIGVENNFFSIIKKCEKLKSLHLQNCQLTLSSAQALSDTVNSGAFKLLEELNLSYSEEIGKVTSFFEALSKCPSLKSLNLNLCCLTLESVEIFVKTITMNSLSNLEKLFLMGNLEIGDSNNFFETLSTCRKLKNLNFDSCDLSSKSLQTLSESFALNRFENLEILDMSNNVNVGKEVSFFISLTKCENLSELFISCCCLTPESCDAVHLLRHRGRRIFA